MNLLLAEGDERTKCTGQMHTLILYPFVFDQYGQVARRCWSGNSNAYETICQAMEKEKKLKVTLPYKVVDDNILEQALSG